jgi:arabinan endo-1,5-alpha-L-arabinosidase
MRRSVHRWMPHAACSGLAALTLILSGCGGGGGGSSSGSTASGAVSTTPDLGVQAKIDNSYQLKIKNVSSGLLLSITGQSQTAGAGLSQAADTGAADQLWHVMPMTGLQYNIENLLTHQVAGITSASTASGAQAVQWADNGTNDHLWSFYLLANGNYLIRNINSGLYLQLDSSGASPVITQSARATSGSGCTCQEWTLTPTSTTAYPMPKTVTGAGTAVHDPNMLQDASGKFWLYGTHNTLASSMDMVSFAAVTNGIITPDFTWWASKNTTGGSGRTDLWAPSTLYANGTYYQYYSIPIYGTPSVAGTNKGAEAVIALATSPSPAGPWTDAGQIIASCGTTSGCTTKYNAIDPAPFIDASGKWWLVFGSWEDGTHILQLDPATGLRFGSNSTLYNTAFRAAGQEGPFIYPWVVNGVQYYYYFASINVCCSGTSSPYRIIVGRSTSPTGPFTDRGGLDLMNGGGTILLSAHGYVYGPGGQSVMTVSGQPTLVYHYYDGNANGAPKLGLNNLGFDTAGWPYVQ